MALVLLASACTESDAAPPTTTTTPPSSTSTVPESTTLPENPVCSTAGSTETSVDVDGDGSDDDIYLVPGNDGYDLAVCSGTVQASVDIGGGNKPPNFAGTFDIDGNGTREIFYSGAAGIGVIYFAVELVDGDLVPIDYSLPVVLESGDAETPITGSSFICNDDEIMVTSFEPAGEGDVITLTPVTLSDGEMAETPEGPIEASAAYAYSVWQAFSGCFEPGPER